MKGWAYGAQNWHEVHYHIKLALSAPGNQPRTHCFLNGLHYIDQTPWQHLTLALSLSSVRRMCAFINIWLPLLVWVFHLSLLSGHWAESAQDLKPELATDGKTCFLSHACCLLKARQIRRVNWNHFHTKYWNGLFMCSFRLSLFTNSSFYDGVLYFKLPLCYF